MGHSYDIVAYTYRADIWCPTCIDEVAAQEIEKHGGHVRDWSPGDSAEQLLNRWAARIRLCREDEATFDSGDFPKVVFRDMLEDDECCGACHKPIEE